MLSQLPAICLRSACRCAALGSLLLSCALLAPVIADQPGDSALPVKADSQETLFVSVEDDGRWKGWFTRDGKQLAVEIPQTRDEIVRFAEQRRYRIDWHVAPTLSADQGHAVLRLPSEQQGVAAGVASAGPIQLASAQKVARPAEEPASQPTKAERITRLQRQIEADKVELEKLRGEIDAPMSDYRRAEAVFQEVDAELQQRKAELEELVKGGKQEEIEQAKSAIATLEMRWKLTREWFDVAIKTRETIQQKIAVTEQKLKQDQQALDRLTSTEPPAPDGAAGGKSGEEPATAAQPSVAAQPGTESAPAADTDAKQAPGPVNAAGAMPLSAALNSVKSAPDRAPKNEKRSRELEQAQSAADEKVKAAEDAEEEAASVSERLQALDRKIELQYQLLEGARKRRDLTNDARQLFGREYRKKSLEGASREELQELADRIVNLENRFGEAGEEVRAGAELLDRFQSERAVLQGQELEALQLAAAKRREAEVAGTAVEELQNPFTPRNIAQWFIDHAPRLMAILIGMALLQWTARFSSRRIARIMTRSGARGSREEREDRANTLMGVVHNAASLAIIVGGILMVCDEVGIAVAPLMGGAAVLGLAVAFGAQNLIRDYFYGFVILLENQYKINDVIKIGETSGQVERITLRITVLRDLEGRVHFIPNGKIDAVTNMTHGWSRALFEIGVAYKEDADYVMGVLLELARELRADTEFGPLILDEPEMLGVDGFGDSAIKIKFILKTRPLKQWKVKRELLRRIKRRFDELGIEIPFPHRTVYHRHPGPAGHAADAEAHAAEDDWPARKLA